MPIMVFEFLRSWGGGEGFEDFDGGLCVMSVGDGCGRGGRWNDRWALRR